MFIGNALIDNDKTTLLILGLSHRNLELLKQGRPMDISRESHGMAIPANLKIMIFADENEEVMRQKMAKFIGPETIIGQKDPQ